MKKVFFTAFAAMAFAFAMTACGGDNKKADENANQAQTEVKNDEGKQCEHKCAHEGDTTKCCKAEGQECDHKCDKACDHKFDKAEGKECCKKAEGKECDHKCQKAEGKECEHKCQK